ncbi:MAG: MFS transporter [Verrucomicrobiae bacterium]|nr:MFS transporter [Verrucomicrobiae bacterium]
MTDPTLSARQPWYHGITKYQWLVLLIACLGWIFDVFEGQIFVASMRDAIPSLLNLSAEHPEVSKWNDWGFAAFAFGGAVGGIYFGMLSDRIGRSKTMILTILFYSVFTLFQAFVNAPWQLMALRFLVAMGVGGEWAVASAMVAEVMPERVRHITSSIFHASSVLGTLLAVVAGAFVVGNPNLGWRWGFAIGVLPALLTLWIRWKLREPEKWTKAREAAASNASAATGRIGDLFRGGNLRNTLVGIGLASIGLITFWGCHIYGKDALLARAQKQALVAEGVALAPPPTAGLSPDEVVATLKPYNQAKAAAFQKHNTKRAEMLSMTLNTIGGGLGLVLFGWISQRMGRKGAFVLYHVVGFALAILLFKVLIPGEAADWVMILVLPLFGFFTLGMHAGYAVYFPELFPTRMRGTGAGFCFNGGRILQGVGLFAIGAMGLAPAVKALYLSPLFLVGAVIVLFGRETRGQELPE